MLLLTQDLDYLDCALNAIKEISGLLTADQYFIKMEHLSREMGDRASPRPQQQPGHIRLRLLLEIIGWYLFPIFSSAIKPC